MLCFLIDLELNSKLFKVKNTNYFKMNAFVVASLISFIDYNTVFEDCEALPV